MGKEMGDQEYREYFEGVFQGEKKVRSLRGGGIRADGVNNLLCVYAFRNDTVNKETPMMENGEGRIKPRL